MGTLVVVLISILAASEARMSDDQIHANKQGAPNALLSSKKEEVMTFEKDNHFFSPSGCFHADRSYCDAEKPCHQVTQYAMLCCDVNVTDIKDLLAVNQHIKYLHMLNVTLDELDVSQASFRRLSSLAITDGNITQVIGEFAKLSATTCLNISNNGIENIKLRAISQLYNISTLDISHNKLLDIPNIRCDKNISIDFRGNNGTHCNKISEQLKLKIKNNGDLKFISPEETFCTFEHEIHSNITRDYVSIEQVEKLFSIQNDCIKDDLKLANCSCDLVRWDIIAGKTPTIAIGVDCSNRHLKHLPAKLPSNTVELNVSYNNITSLKPLVDHPSYEHVRKLYADHNEIQSILDLEGTKFIENFIVLSLKSNKLKTIQTYILSDSFDRNRIPRQVFLSNNYLSCDCATARQTKMWLLSNTNNIPDRDQVYCENIPGPLSNLVESKVCPRTKDWTDYIYFIIAMETLLLLGLVAKVFYDYWIYKTAGYLPWPASEMPKLPCDWLCE